VTNWSAVSYPDFADWRAQNSELECIAVYTNQSLTLINGNEATHIMGEAVSADLFPLLGVQPFIGRLFTNAEDEPGNRVAILSYGLWQRRFGGDRQIVGRNIMLDGRSYQVIGIMPEQFQYPVQSMPVELWTTVATLRESADGAQPMTEQRGNDFLFCIARLKPGTSLPKPRPEWTRLVRRFDNGFPIPTHTLA
jgi:putative ABC transport system permease protein